jgi:hypothetical protein
VQPEKLTVADFLDIKETLEEYWGPLDERGERFLRALHHPLSVYEFGETALKAPTPASMRKPA